MKRPTGDHRPRSRRLRALEARLGVEAATDRFWLAPAVVLVGTILAFLTIGQITSAPLYVSLPNGVVIALVMAGLSVACMSADADEGPRDDPPDDRDDAPVLGSPGGPWTVVAHLGGPEPGPVTDERAPALSRSSAGDRR